jgi:tRNA(Ile)-lysidine synthase
MDDEMEAVLRDECGLVPGRPVVAGVSGGPDSLCLLEVMRRAGYPVVVAHFNHRLRPEADAEAEAVARRARTLGLPFETGAADVGAHAAANGQSVEEAARTLRYRFLFAVARKHTAQAVATGHTADDQVETVLMHFLRGAGLDGLKGMQPRTLLLVFDPEIPLVRPLLGWRRADTEEYCRKHDLRPSYDASNADPAYFRNRLRHALIPELEKYSPHFKDNLLRTALALQGDHALLEEVVEMAWRQAVPASGLGWVAFDRRVLAEAPSGLRRALIRRAGQGLRPESRDFGFAAVQRAETFIAAPAGKTLDFGCGLYFLAEGDRIFLAAYEADLPSAHWPQVEGEQTLVVPGAVALGDDWQLSAEMAAVPQALADAQGNADPYQAWLDAEITGDRLIVRTAPLGARFQPLGMNRQSLKLSDLFVNVKLPRRARRKWPVIFAGPVPVWVPGYRLAEPGRVTEKTQRAVHLVLQKL